MRARRTIAVITALFGLILTTAAPASAVEPGTWRPYGNKNPITTSSSQWRCASSVEIASSVVAQVCSIRSGGGNGWDVQGAVIVRNNRSTAFSTSASVTVYDRFNVEVINTWSCGSSGVAANSWSVCFGATFLHHTIYSEGSARGVDLGQTGDL